MTSAHRQVVGLLGIFSMITSLVAAAELKCSEEQLPIFRAENGDDKVLLCATFGGDGWFMAAETIRVKLQRGQQKAYREYELKPTFWLIQGQIHAVLEQPDISSGMELISFYSSRPPLEDAQNLELKDVVDGIAAGPSSTGMSIDAQLPSLEKFREAIANKSEPPIQITLTIGDLCWSKAFGDILNELAALPEGTATHHVQAISSGVFAIAARSAALKTYGEEQMKALSEEDESGN